ncbi:MAG: hypothetical protein IPG50_31385 [Myxococcales bacterium]|nr:hypothetical protein [Myxococcales bacterium]
MNSTQTISLATSVASLLALAACSSTSENAASTTTGTQADALVKCEGVNSCKGQSECQSADGKSGCQGLNDCAGKGWITIPRSECDKKGGKVLVATDAGASPASKDAALAISEGGSKPLSLKCEGINSCKGQGECASADGANGCKGQNSCAGHGWISVPKESDCSKKGGKLIS